MPTSPTVEPLYSKSGGLWLLVVLLLALPSATLGATIPGSETRDPLNTNVWGNFVVWETKDAPRIACTQPGAQFGHPDGIPASLRAGASAYDLKLRGEPDWSGPSTAGFQPSFPDSSGFTLTSRDDCSMAWGDSDYGWLNMDTGDFQVLGHASRTSPSPYFAGQGEPFSADGEYAVVTFDGTPSLRIDHTIGRTLSLTLPSSAASSTAYMARSRVGDLLWLTGDRRGFGKRPSKLGMLHRWTTTNQHVVTAARWAPFSARFSGREVLTPVGWLDPDAGRVRPRTQPTGHKRQPPGARRGVLSRAVACW